MNVGLLALVEVVAGGLRSCLAYGIFLLSSEGLEPLYRSTDRGIFVEMRKCSFNKHGWTYIFLPVQFRI